MESWVIRIKQGISRHEEMQLWQRFQGHRIIDRIRTEIGGIIEDDDYIPPRIIDT